MKGISQENWERTPQAVHEVLQQWFEELKQLRQQLRELRAENEQLRSENQQLHQEVAELREQVGRNPRNSSQPPSSEHPHAAKPKPPTRRGSQRKKKRGGQPGHKKHKRALIPTEECQQVVLCQPDQCPSCGGELSGSDPHPRRHQVWDIPPIEPIVTEYQQHTLSCDGCGSRTQGVLPEEVPAGMFGPHVIALVALLSGQFRQSKRQVQTFLAAVFSLPISLGQVCKLQQLASDALRPPYEELRQALPRSDVANIDETPWKEGEARVYVWAAETAACSVFAIGPRTKEMAQELLRAFDGVLGTDRFGSYDWVDSQQRQLCWAHLLRDFQGMIDRGGDSQRIGKHLQEAAVTLFHHWHRFQEGAITRRTLHRHVLALQGEVHEWLEEGVHHCEHPKTAGQCQHIWERFDALWAFAAVEGVGPTNNAAERALRKAVIWRKLSFGTQSEWGSRYVERMLSVIETCRKQGRRALEFVATCVRHHLAKQPAPLLLAEDQ